MHGVSWGPSVSPSVKGMEPQTEEKEVLLALQAGALVRGGAGAACEPRGTPSSMHLIHRGSATNMGGGGGDKEMGKKPRFPTVLLGVRCPLEPCIFVT